MENAKVSKVHVKRNLSDRQALCGVSPQASAFVLLSDLPKLAGRGKCLTCKRCLNVVSRSAPGASF